MGKGLEADKITEWRILHSRVHAFARAFDLPIVRVMTGGGDIQDEAWEGDGTLVNSPPFDGLSWGRLA